MGGVVTQAAPAEEAREGSSDRTAALLGRESPSRPRASYTACGKRLGRVSPLGEAGEGHLREPKAGLTDCCGHRIAMGLRILKVKDAMGGAGPVASIRTVRTAIPVWGKQVEAVR